MYKDVDEVVVAQVLEANRRSGQYDLGAAMQALRVGTRRNMLCQSPLSSSAILWRSIVLSACGNTDASADVTTIADQEWHQILDRGLHPLSKVLETERPIWMNRKDISLCVPLPVTYGENLDFAMENFPSTVEIACIDPTCATKLAQFIGSATISPPQLLEQQQQQDTMLWSHMQWIGISHPEKDQLGSKMSELRVEFKWNPEPDQHELLRLRVVVLSAKDLPKMDIIGTNDPYVEVTVQGFSQHTATASGGGAEPSWGDGKGEVLEFDISPSAQTALIRCFDEDVGADDLIGSGVSRLAANTKSQTEKTAWARQECIQLRKKGKGYCGSVNVLLQCWNPLHEPEPALPPVRRMRVTVLAARKLLKMDNFDENDPYCDISVGGVVKRTETINNGGQCPVWGGGSGEAVEYTLYSAPESVAVRCFDHDAGSDDDLIGSGTLDLRLTLESTRWQRDEWISLVNDRKQRAGDLHVVIQCWNAVADPEPEPVKMQLMRVTVLSASELPTMDMIGDNDPYCVFSIDGFSIRSTTVDGGGSNPIWGGGTGESVEFLVTSPPAKIGMECYDEDIGADDLVGKSVVKVHKEPSVRRWIREETTVLRNMEGGLAGDHCLLAFLR